MKELLLRASRLIHKRALDADLVAELEAAAEQYVAKDNPVNTLTNTKFGQGKPIPPEVGKQCAKAKEITLRDKFEKWATERHLDLTPNIVGDYLYIGTKDAWLAYQAATERAALICIGQGKEWDSDEVVTTKNYAAHCAELIRGEGK